MRWEELNKDWSEGLGFEISFSIAYIHILVRSGRSSEIKNTSQSAHDHYTYLSASQKIA